MKRFILFIVLISVTSLSSVAQVPDGFYHGGDKLFSVVFLKKQGDTAFADFIHWDKFPRQLVKDTLVFNSTDQTWSGNFSRLATVKEKLVIDRKEGSVTEINYPLFGRKGLHIKENEKRYKEVYNEYTNLAVMNQYYRAYIEKNGETPEARKRYYSIYEKSQLDSIKLLDHQAFLLAHKRFTAELEGR